MVTTCVLTNQVFTNVNDTKLGLESTLQDLPLWEVSIELSLPASNLSKLFEEEPLLPGIILTNNGLYVGIISRRKFFEKMSQSYSLDLYSQRPIEILYKMIQQVVFTLDEKTSVIEATRWALQRSPELIYEPILVETASGRYRLVDFQALLLAYSEIHVLTLDQLQRVEEKSKTTSTDLHHLQHKYNQLLEKEKNEKVAALEQLVTGIVQQINKPVTFIAGNLIHAKRYIQELLQIISLYRQFYPDPAEEVQTALNQIELHFSDDEIAKLLTSMKSGSQHIRQIVRSLQHFSYLDESEKKAVDIHKSINSALLLLENRLKPCTDGESITIVKEYKSLTLVECYVEQLKQVFINILSNAIDSLEEGMKNWNSRIDIEQDLLPKDEPPKMVLRISTEMPAPFTHVVIRIADNGPGMIEKVRQRIFEPFFSTKPVGKGTGLGLFISYQIVVEKHRGQLDCISAPGQGTEFIIKIPVQI
ncbi:sensor histidine kinase [Mastigocladopsis repens]|uniref:sensor histidine kinase n=1 Tax=Mastigocladopsis repens TaxID=221287 RepID=UPI0002FEE452|nr:ATP-binding protein [Mastigocladopsis repens]